MTDAPPRPLDPGRTGAEAAYRALRQAIIDQELPPGTRLPEDDIGRPFGISRTLVRQALQRLHGDGLVELGHKRTATVAQPTLAEARNVFSVRRALEREVVHAVAARWQPEFARRLEAHVRLEEDARRAGDERVSIRLAGEFHQLLAELSGNDILEGYVTQLVCRSSLILALYARPHSAECAVSEHRGVIVALSTGDAEKAAALMDHHVGSVAARALVSDGRAERPLGDILMKYGARPGSATMAREQDI
ncbi:GntR family transcriptional regulator [Salipiger sp. H15]|uniref:GntR family transcriptional regulator n=1 Tax=Alloyangia sp. H15 TaxID=3029062 RepID=A0AAU8ANA9_9RHOB